MLVGIAARLRALILSLSILAALAACEAKVTTQDNCGDEFLDPGEACDGAELGGVTCESLGYYRTEGQVRCTAGCQLDTSDCGLARCGDEAIQGTEGEQCEGTNLGGASCVTLGYATGTLTCDELCRFDLTACVADADCGNGELQEGEQCDTTNFGAQTCETLGYHGGNLTCTGACQLDLSDCVEIGRCGDARIQATFGEECDGANLDGKSCLSLGYHGGTLACSGGCILDVSSCETEGRCGDGDIQTTYGEECDGANLDEQTCLSLGYHGGTLTCDGDCHRDVSSCVAAGRCGDGGVQELFGEECDGANLDGESCETLGYYGGALVCDGACLFDEAPCAAVGRCGDGTIQFTEGEVCDGANLNVTTCVQRGFWGGSLACDPACSTFDESGCRRLVKLDAGVSHTCAIDDAGGARCWGARTGGGLGDGQSAGTYNIPGAVQASGTLFTEISAGQNFTCALDTAGALWCWGVNNSGQLGSGGTTMSTVPQRAIVPVGMTFNQISAGASHACALATTGEVLCWGYNNQGRLGDGTTTNRLIPTPVNSIKTFVRVQAGRFHSCAIDTDDQLHCWGANGYNQIHEMNTEPVLSPLPVAAADAHAVLDVGVGNYHTCVVTGAASGNLFCKGANGQGQLGYFTGGVPSLAFGSVPTSSGARVVQVQAGDVFTCARLSSGLVYCWGNNDFGQLGDGAQGTTRHSAALITTTPPGKAFSGLSAGAEHACAWDAAGLAWCWGNNELGTLGDGTFTNSDLPVSVWPI